MNLHDIHLFKSTEFIILSTRRRGALASDATTEGLSSQRSTSLLVYTNLNAFWHVATLVLPAGWHCPLFKGDERREQSERSGGGLKINLFNLNS